MSKVVYIGKYPIYLSIVGFVKIISHKKNLLFTQIFINIASQSSRVHGYTNRVEPTTVVKG